MANSDESTETSNHTNKASFSDNIRELRTKRDEYNQKTKRLINKLKALNAQIRDIRNEAAANRKIRDTYNEKVQELKEKRTELQDTLNELRDRLREFRESQQEEEPDDNGSRRRPVSVARIKRKIQRYETRIVTEEISLEEENDLIKEIGELEALLADERERHGESLEYRKIQKKFPKIRKQLNSIHEELIESSKSSQNHHEEMIGKYKEADALREKKMELEKQLIASKKTADEYHEQLLKLYSEREKYRSKRGSRKRSRRVLAQQRQEIMDEKLQTAIEKQKAGKKLDMLEARLLLEKSFKDS